VTSAKAREHPECYWPQCQWSNGFWLGRCKVTGLRPNVRVQYERISGLNARIIAKPLTEPGFVLGVDLCESIAETPG
jgi:hypothetical protein